MTRRYSWLWFDADGTLFDFHRAEALALEGALREVEGLFESGHLDDYREINQALWAALERHEITPAEIPLRRFTRLAEALALRCDPAALSAAYIEHLARRGELLEGAFEVVRALAPTHRLALVTNGLSQVQHRRLACSAVADCFEAVIVSEEVGAAKPHPGFFDAAFAATGHPAKSDVLVIGDSLSSDIRGAADYGLDCCWYNPTREPRPDSPAMTFEIARLGELREWMGL